MKKYWFTLTPETFIWTNKSNILIYNSNLKKSVVVSQASELISLTKGLQNPINLYCIEIDEKQLQNTIISEFITKIIQNKSGRLIESTLDSKKPIQLPPILNLQCEISKLKKDKHRSLGENIIRNLNQIDIHIDNTISISNKDYFLNPLKQLLSAIPDRSNIIYNIIIKDQITKSTLRFILDVLKTKNDAISIHIHFQNLHNLDAEQLKLIPETCQIKLIGLAPIKNYIIKDIQLQIGQLPNTITWEFLIHSEYEYEEIILLVEKMNIVNYDILPTFNGENLDFFEKNIYLTYEDLAAPDLNKREIFAHQAINTNNFGKIIIKSDGNIYSNEYTPPLGNSHNSLKEILTKEMELETSWFKIRDMEPCNECVYQWLCPSPSNYEIEIGKPNLCHIKQ